MVLDRVEAHVQQEVEINVGENGEGESRSLFGLWQGERDLGLDLWAFESLLDVLLVSTLWSRKEGGRRRMDVVLEFEKDLRSPPSHLGRRGAFLGNRRAPRRIDRVGDG